MEAIKEEAKELINKFYQPLGYLKCQVSSDEMWEYSKKSALIVVEMMIRESSTGYDYDMSAEMPYYEELKKAIENF
jgi:hypothetical protein